MSDPLAELLSSFAPGSRRGFGAGAGARSGNGFGNSSNPCGEFARMFGGLNKPATRPSPQVFQMDFGVSLADFYSGASKKARISCPDDSTKSQVVEFEIQPGWRSGVKVSFAKTAWDSAASAYGDVILVLTEKKSDLFQRRAVVFPDSTDTRPDGEKLADLIYFMSITVDEAVRGFSKIIKHLDGRELTIEFESAVNQKEVKIDGEGMPIRKKGEIVGRGDLFVRLKVEI